MNTKQGNDPAKNLIPVRTTLECVAEMNKFIEYQYEHSYASYGITREQIFQANAYGIQTHMDNYTDWRQHLTEREFIACSNTTHENFDKLNEFLYKKSRSN